MSRPTGIIVYQGPSQIDGKPIVCIATGISRKSKNPKTGNVIQTYIMSQKDFPTEAKRNGSDYSVCGDCKMRKLGMCYTNTKCGINGTYKAWKQGKYEKLNMKNYLCFMNKIIRWGSYGDPASLPVEVIDKIMKVADSCIGYTHQFSRCHQRLQNYCMASVDTTKELREAKRMGWRTFRIRLKEEVLQKGEFMCPASKEAGMKTTCDKCMSCGGHNSKAKRDVAIVVHGEKFKVKRFYKFKKVRVPSGIA